ncbi:hypothetical protein WOLCODRAFT_140032 [Wolfiporia cocos MD-104 SS10]|uniref:Uncharacterized protein n=1 Tax=Wolfiporia cocos (strain MD-104) TaxID=742152 RepID=A0A2H3J0C6_WOLCO|nr:hypothetical protein WOLCODRAFT_140032 [Wolfiporia cocos MD-104 SS10]
MASPPQYQAVSTTEAKDFESSPVPRLSPFPGYQATYRVETPLLATESGTPARSCRRRRIVRCLHATVLSLIFITLVPAFIHDIQRFARAFHNLIGGEHAPMQVPAQGVDVPPYCVQEAEWTFDPNTHRQLHGFRHVADASFALPTSSDLLFFTAHGSGALAHGNIQIVASDNIDPETVQVDVSAYYNDVDDLVELTKVCLLQPEEGHNGVGIYAPVHWSDRHNRRRVMFEIIVQIPSHSSIKKLDTMLPLFAHFIDNLKDHVFFDTISLHTSNMPIQVKALAATLASATTSNSPIEGSFNTSEALVLRTSNSPVRIHAGLLNNEDNYGSHTSLDLKTSNGPVTANISLYSTSGSNTGGVFDVGIYTSNSPMHIAFLDAPVDHLLTMRAHTTNGPVLAALHETYEGTFSLRSSAFFRPTIQVDRSVEDPAGKGRQRVVDVRTLGRGFADGRVLWTPSERQNVGSVEVSTSNMGLDLRL